MREIEKRLSKEIETELEATLGFLAETVEINSGTFHPDGVRRVGRVYQAALEALGLRTWWDVLPPAMGRGDHLFAEIDGGSGPRLLLIGHLDTVFEPDSGFDGFRREGRFAHGPGVEDMKGGNAVIVGALRGLYAAGALSSMRVVVALMADEEEPGEPVEASRRGLRELAERCDVALGFEAGVESLGRATIARRGFSGWRAEVEARSGHSSIVFSERVGAGAGFELARVLNAFREALATEPHLTFSPGLVAAGTRVAARDEGRLVVDGKTNVIARHAVVEGDLRFLSAAQLEAARERMRTLAAASLPGTRTRLTFTDGYPAMPPTDANRRLLGVLDGVNRDLGLGPVTALDPDRQGAADISFVADRVAAAMDALGPLGSGAHTLEERIDLEVYPDVLKRAALLLSRLGKLDGAP